MSLVLVNVLCCVMDDIVFHTHASFFNCRLEQEDTIFSAAEQLHRKSYPTCSGELQTLLVPHASERLSKYQHPQFE